MSREKFTQKRDRKKISATMLTQKDLDVIYKLQLESGSKEAILLRGLIRIGISEIEKKKISTLELIRIGAY